MYKIRSSERPFHIGALLRRCRKRNKTRIVKAAKIHHVHRNTITRWENEYALITLNDFLQYLDRLGYDVEITIQEKP